jgi:hypothetical protein
MTVIDPNTGLLITCEPWEYAELCKSNGWIKTTYETDTTPKLKYDFTTSTFSSQEKEPKTYTEKMTLSEEDKAIAEKAAKLIARDYGEVLRRLEDE